MVRLVVDSRKSSILSTDYPVPRSLPCPGVDVYNGSPSQVLFVIRGPVTVRVGGPTVDEKVPGRDDHGDP